MKLLLLLKIFVVTIDAAASILGKNDNTAPNLNITPIRILATPKVPIEVNPSLITKTSTAYTEATPNNDNSLLYVKNKQNRIPTLNKANVSETITVTTTETLLAPPTITQFASCQQPNSINTSTMMYNPAECSQRNSLPDGEICENNDQCLSGKCRLVQINGIKKCQNDDMDNNHNHINTGHVRRTIIIIVSVVVFLMIIAVTFFLFFRKKKPTTSITLEHNDKKLTVDIEDDDNESLILEDLLPEPPNRAYFSTTADDLIWGNGNRASDGVDQRIMKLSPNHKTLSNYSIDTNKVDEMLRQHDSNNNHNNIDSSNIKKMKNGKIHDIKASHLKVAHSGSDLNMNMSYSSSSLTHSSLSSSCSSSINQNNKSSSLSSSSPLLPSNSSR